MIWWCLSGEEADPAGLEYLVSEGVEGVARPHQGQDVGEAQQWDHNHQGAGRLVVQSLHLPRPGGLQLGHHRRHHHHQEHRVEEQQGEDRQLVEVDVIWVVFYQRAAQEGTDHHLAGDNQE